MSRRRALLTVQEGTVGHRAFQVAGWACFVLPLLVAPYILPGFRVSQLAQSAAWAVAILGLNLALGYSGLISLGHVAFTGVGAYTTTVLINERHWEFWMTLPAAFVVCLLVGALVGLPAVRIKGLYLALVTLALAYTFPILVKIDAGPLDRWTGGDNGKNLTELLEPTSWAKSLLGLSGKEASSATAIYRYFCMVAVGAVCFLLVRNMIKSSPGRSMIASRDNPISAAVTGVPVTRQKVKVFALSAAFAGIGGSMLAAVLGSVGPTTFGPDYAILTLMGLVLGGVGSLHGCWLAGLLVVFLQDFAPRIVTWIPALDLDPVYAQAVFGLILILVALFLRGGIVSTAQRVRARIVTVVPAVPAGADVDVAATATVAPHDPGPVEPVVVSPLARADHR